MKLLGALLCVTLAPAAWARKPPPAPRSFPSSALRQLVRRSQAVLLVRVQRVLSRARVSVDGRHERLGRRRVAVLSTLKGSVRRGRALILYDASTRWGSYRAGARRNPRRGRLIAFVVQRAARWHLARRAAYALPARLATVRRAVRIEARRAALLRRLLRYRRHHGSVLRLLGKRTPATPRRSRGGARQARSLSRVVAREVSGEKKVVDAIRAALQRRAAACRLYRAKACVVLLRLSVAPTYGSAVEFVSAKQSDCHSSAQERKCLERRTRGISGGGARASALFALYYK